MHRAAVAVVSEQVHRPAAAAAASSGILTAMWAWCVTLCTRLTFNLPPQHAVLRLSNRVHTFVVLEQHRAVVSAEQVAVMVSAVAVWPCKACNETIVITFLRDVDAGRACRHACTH